MDHNLFRISQTQTTVVQCERGFKFINDCPSHSQPTTPAATGALCRFCVFQLQSCADTSLQVAALKLAEDENVVPTRSAAAILRGRNCHDEGPDSQNCRQMFSKHWRGRRRLKLTNMVLRMGSGQTNEIFTAKADRVRVGKAPTRA